MPKSLDPSFQPTTGSISLYGFQSTAGELHPNAKLTNAQVLDIRSSTAPAAALALQYGVSIQCIYSVKARRTYGKVKANG